MATFVASDLAGPLLLYETCLPSGTATRFVSPLPREHVARVGGLRAEAVIGWVKDNDRPLQPDNFTHNADFLRFLHNCIARHATGCPSLCAKAERVRNGFVYVLDGRAPHGAGSSEETIGVVTVKDSRLHDYRPFPGYRAYTTAGFLRLEPWLHERLLDDLGALPLSGGAPAP